MLIVREIFQLKFGAYRQVRSLLDDAIEKKLLSPGLRILTDFTGDGYRFIIEQPAEDLADFERKLKEELSQPAWGEWYQKFMPHVQSSHREILKVIMQL
ncbi:MAG: hypothetical protein JWN76_1704 [Chitinophagaceae bacterium]|nr:hypothetical protein [Chitinophagaceae bacterium]